MNIDQDLVVTSIEAAAHFDQMRVLFHEDCEWDCEEGDILPSINKALDLVTTFEQGHCLQSKLTIGDEPWNRLISKMIGLAENLEHLNLLVHDYFQYETLERREIIRKVFDRADELAV